MRKHAPKSGAVARRVRRRSVFTSLAEPAAREKAGSGAHTLDSAARREKPKPRPRVKLAEAMRTRGLDELKLAAKFDRLIDHLGGTKLKNEKVLLEVLKEVSKIFEPQQAARLGTGQDPVPVQLVHYVPRPERAPLVAGEKSGG